MARDNLERLVVSLSADIKSYERQLNKANGVTGRQAGRIEKRFKTMNSRVAGYGRTAFAGFATGALAALGPLALFNRAINDIGDASKIGKVADKVGLAVTELQQLRHVAELAGVPANQLDVAMQRFSRRVAEAATGAGELRKVLEANGVALRDADGTMRSQRDILRDYANLIANAGSEQEQLLLAFKAFDTEGAALVNLLKQGGAAIDTMVAKTEEAGGVLDERLVRRAEELDDKLTIMWRSFSINSKSAILTAADSIDTLISKADEFGNSSFFKWLAGTLPTVGGADLTYLDPDLARAQGQELGPDARIRDAFAGELQTADAELVEALKKRYGTATAKAASTVIPTAGSGKGTTRKEALDRDLELAGRVIENLEHERSLIGLNNRERAKANALRQAGTKATAAQRAEIGHLVDAIYEERDATEKAAAAAEELRGIGRETMGGLISDLLSGKSAADALADALKNVGDRLLNMALDGLFSGLGGGSGGGLLGGAIIPGILHSGGVAGRDGYGHGRSVSPSVFAGAQRYHSGGVAGLRPGEIPAILQKGELVIPKSPSMPTLRSSTAGAGETYAPQYNIDARGAEAGVEQKISQALRAYDKGNYQRWLSGAAQARKRNAG